MSSALGMSAKRSFLLPAGSGVLPLQADSRPRAATMTRAKRRTSGRAAIGRGKVRFDGVTSSSFPDQHLVHDDDHDDGQADDQPVVEGGARDLRQRVAQDT